MIKNLLLLKNELLALEIGHVRNGNPQINTAGSVTGRLPKEMQHFGQIWEGMVKPVTGGLVAGIWSRVGSLGGYMPSLPLPALPGIPGWSTPTSSTPAGTDGNASVDVHEQLDNELRASIGAFTRRWAGLLAGGSAGGNGKVMGGKNVAKVERELDEILERAFGGLVEGREVIMKLREAVAGVVEEMREKERQVSTKAGGK